MVRRLALLGLFTSLSFAQNPCANTPAYSPCEMIFELLPGPHPHPYQSVDLHAEFRSPRHRTFKVPGFWDGGRRLVLRFSPTEPGAWDYRITSNVVSLDGTEGHFDAAASTAAGFVEPANVHHWKTENNQPHLWLGGIEDRLAYLPEAEFQARVDDALRNKLNHLRLTILGESKLFNSAGEPQEIFFRELDRRIGVLNQKGIVADLVFAATPDQLGSLVPDRDGRQRFIKYLIGRYAAFNITWMGVEAWERGNSGRELLKAIGLLLKDNDPYNHPRSTCAEVTSSALAGDGWMTFIVNSANPVVGSVEHQLYPMPFVGIAKPEEIWAATVNGQYPMLTQGNRAPAKAWWDLISSTRHWETEPYFDVDGGRAIALEDTEYVVYIDHPSQPIEVTVEKHGYDVQWMNPLTGDLQEAKKYHGEHFTGEVPERSHGWVLLIGREGRKERMLRSYKFESRALLMQEVEAQKVPFAVVEPAHDTLPAGVPVPFSTKITRATRATRTMMYLWTGEVVPDNRGARVLATTDSGSFTVPRNIAAKFPAVLNVRVTALNANGKAYLVDKVYQLNK